MKERPPFDVFVSYSPSDARVVEDLALLLCEVGQREWLDRWELAPGQAWKDALTEARERSFTALVCIGPSGASLWQQGEVRAVLDDNRIKGHQSAVVLLLLPGSDPASLPTSLFNFAWIDLRQRIDDPDQIARLLVAIGAAKTGERKASLESREYDRSLAMSYNKVGDMNQVRGQVNQAQEAYLKALEIRERLAAAEPDRADYQRDLSVSYNKIGDLSRALGQGEAARQAYLKALEIAERLAAAEPDQADYQRDLSMSYNKMGDLLGGTRSPPL